MAGFMEVSFPMNGLVPSAYPGADLQCHRVAAVPVAQWNFQSVQHNFSQPQNHVQSSVSRKRSCGQAFSCTDISFSKRSRPEDMPFGLAIQPLAQVQPSPMTPFLPPCQLIRNEQVCGYPSSFLEHQNMVNAEKKYQSSMLEALLYEVHGC